MDDSNRGNVASASPDDSIGVNASFSPDNVKQERFDPPKGFSESNYEKSGIKQSKEKSKSSKRQYQKKQKGEHSGGIEKPPPKKRGRKSKKELQLMDIKSEYAMEFQPTFKKVKNRSPSQQQQQQKSHRAPKKNTTGKAKKNSGPPPGPSVFDKKILAGPHLTMKQVLEYILTDHSYCVPPDPLPAVSSNHQMIRYILGPKNGAKARSLPISVGMLESEDRSPLSYSGIPRARGQLNLTSTPSSPASSKLENLLKRGDSSPLHLGGGALRFPHSKSLADGRDESDVDIDVESVDPEPEKRVAYDVQKAKEVMKECEKYVEFARTTDTGDNWESKLVRTGWTKTQSALFDKVIGALHAERLARLTFESAGDTEPVLRRASLDKTACRIRRIFGEYLWDTKLTQWLHSVITEYLNFSYLAMYMDVLQTLKSQCPQLISRMMKLSIITPLQTAYGRNNELQDLLTPYIDDRDLETPGFTFEGLQSEPEKATLGDSSSNNVDQENSQNKPAENEIYIPAKSVAPQVEDAMEQLHSAKNAEAFRILLERQWDPFSQDLLPRLKKLSANPVFVVIAPGAIFTKLSLNRRLKQYYRMFNRVGKVVKVRPNTRAALQMTSPSTYLEKLFARAKEKIKDVRHCFPERPLFIVGWGSGSILAARLSVTTGPVDGIVALGFPLHSLREIQDDMVRIFGGIKHPILFVIGGLASNNSLTDMELFRRRLACETSLVVVGSGNENLYVSRDHREKLLITQSFSDKTVMDEIAYFVNLHSKHNQIITANISVKPHHFPKSQTDGFQSRKSTSLLRGKKRKASFSDVDAEGFIGSNNEDSKDSYDSEIERVHDTSGATMGGSMRRDLDPNKLGYDYGYDGPKFVPSNKSCNKRKAYSSYRPDPNSTSSSISSSSCITASQLLQQSPNVKRRMSKPSGPTQRVPLLNPPPTQRSGQAGDPPKDDAAALYKYLSEHHQQQQQQQNQSKAHQYPFTGEPQPAGSEKMFMGSYASKDSTTDKGVKRKSNSKSKVSKASKTNTSESPVSSIVSALNEVTPSMSSLSNAGTPSSVEMRKLVQQMRMKQHEQNQDRPHSSQLFKLLSPGTDPLGDTVNLAPLPNSSTPNVSQGSAELVKVKLIGSQTLPSEGEGDTRTALISKQNLVSNLSLPMIRLSRPGETEECSQQAPLFVSGTSGTGSTILANLPTDSTDKILLRTSDQSIMKLNATDLKNLIAGGRGIQLFTGVPGSGPVNIIVKKSSESADSKPTTLGDISTTGSNESLVASISTPRTFSVPSLVIPVTETSKATDTTTGVTAAQVETPDGVSMFETSGVHKMSESAADATGEMESMEVDAEEEMSGLLISSTFSVCPTSGERVLPPASTNPFNDSSIATDIVKTGDLGELDNEEALAVPIHIQSSNVSLTSENLVPLTPVAVSDIDMSKNSEAAVEVQGQITPPKSDSLITLTPLEPTPAQETESLPSTIISTPPPPPPSLFFAVKSKPKELTKDNEEKVKNPPEKFSPSKANKPAKQNTKAATKSKSSKTDSNTASTSGSTPSKPSKKVQKTPSKAMDKVKVSTAARDEKKPKEKSKKATKSANVSSIASPVPKISNLVDNNAMSSTERVPTEPDTSKDAKLDETNKESISSVEPAATTCSSDQVPSQESSTTPGTPATSSASNTTNIEDSAHTESESSEKNDGNEKTASDDHSDSASTSEEDKQKSKNNPVRRSARLKSGV